jgi:7-carboxy-7-deazaguanine synthase
MLQVNEIFYSIQGESTRAGLPCVFVRLTGCNLRCTWCDTAYAFHEGSPMTVDDVLGEVARHGCSLVEVTGGEPLLQADAIPLMQRLLDTGHTVLLETGGSLPIEDVPPGVHRIVDIKCPASGEVERTRWENLEQLRDGDELKFVIANRDDYRWAVQAIRRHGLAGRAPLLFSTVHGSLDPGEMSRWILADGIPARVQVQLHKLLWPDVERGI